MVALALKQPALFEMNADPEPTAPSVHRTPGHTQSQSTIDAGGQRYSAAAPPASVHSAGHSATALDASLEQCLRRICPVSQTNRRGDSQWLNRRRRLAPHMGPITHGADYGPHGHGDHGHRPHNPLCEDPDYKHPPEHGPSRRTTRVSRPAGSTAVRFEGAAALTFRTRFEHACFKPRKEDCKPPVTCDEPDTGLCVRKDHRRADLRRADGS